MIELARPSMIRELCVTMLKPERMPENHGAAIYYSLPPFKDWEYVGSISAQMPSQIYSAPWRGTVHTSVRSVRLGISVESREFIQNLHPRARAEEAKKLISSVQGIARDLYTFVTSFARSTVRGDMVVIPVKFIQAWLKKFEAKHKRDPYFWLKSTS